MTGRKYRICFVAPMAWPILARDRSIPLVGGAEVQQVYLARELARRGHMVSMVCMDHGQADGVVVDGVAVYRMHALGAGLPGVRFVHPGLTSVWAAMRRANADFYYQRAAGALTAFAVAFARRHERRAIFAGASDMDFTADLPQIRFARDRQLYRWGLLRAHAVVAQSARQAQACEMEFRRPATTIRSCQPCHEATASQAGDILWVGSVKAIKRPEWVVHLARMLPQFKFRLVGGAAAADLQELCRQGMPSNLTMVGFVPHADVGLQFDGTSVLLNTSTQEGFPNTLLQAWARGVPTVATFDPELTFEGHALNEVVSSLDEMAQRLVRFKGDAVHWRLASERVRKGVESLFSVDAAVDAYEDLFERLSQDKGRAPLAMQTLA